jgi:hypothetical protein
MNKMSMAKHAQPPPEAGRGETTGDGSSSFVWGGFSFANATMQRNVAIVAKPRACALSLGLEAF